MTSPWRPGRAVIEDLINKRHLVPVTGAAADGASRAQEAQTRIESAVLIADSHPAASFTLAYDGVRLAATALMIQQGLRPSSDGGHVALVDAVKAQFGAHFEMFNVMRRIRNRLEYPDSIEDATISIETARTAIEYGQKTCGAVVDLLPQLGIWQ